MIIRAAKKSDFEVLYRIGSCTAELKVRQDRSFMDKDDFFCRISDRNHVFLIGEIDRKIGGFIVANCKDIDRPLKNKFACLVYLAVLKKFRRNGMGSALYTECMSQLRRKGITSVYAWANAREKAIQMFLGRHHFRKGNHFIWMEADI